MADGMRLSQSILNGCLIRSLCTGNCTFMSGRLLTAWTSMKCDSDGPKRDFTFQHKLCYDFESLIWVVVYAIMIHHRNNLAPTDPAKCKRYKTALDHCWAAHAYSTLLRSHNNMILTGCTVYAQDVVNWWVPDPPEAAFFRDAMRLIRTQTDGYPITYQGLCALFKSTLSWHRNRRLLI